MKKGILIISILIGVVMAVSATPNPIAGTWKTYDGEILDLNDRGEMTFSQTKSVNAAPGTITSKGRYTYDSATQRLSYTIFETELKNSAGYDEKKTYGTAGRSFVETAVIKGNHLYWANKEYTDASKAEDNSTKSSDSSEIDALITRLKDVKVKMATGDADAMKEFQDISARLMAKSSSFSPAQLDRFMKIAAP